MSFPRMKYCAVGMMWEFPKLILLIGALLIIWLKGYTGVFYLMLPSVIISWNRLKDLVILKPSDKKRKYVLYVH